VVRCFFTLLVLSVLAAGCGTREDARRRSAADDRAAAIYTAVVRQLILKDNTFGAGAAPFDRIYVVDGVVQGNRPGLPRDPQPFDRDVKTRLAKALPDLPLEFVRDPDSVVVRKDQCAQVRGNGALVSLGPISNGTDTVKVWTGLFFSCLGARSGTYLVHAQDGEWRVKRTIGPVAIA